MTTQQKAIRRAYGSLGAALAQSLPSDDQITMEHVRAAHAALELVLFDDEEAAAQRALARDLADAVKYLREREEREKAA